jgi:hypothetical protein
VDEAIGIALDPAQFGIRRILIGLGERLLFRQRWVIASSLGKMPMTSVLRLISLFSRSSPLVE